jgi:hypothetical protein
MNTRFVSRITRVAVRAARPAGRSVVRALRHHLARAQLLSGTVAPKIQPVNGIRSWFHGFFSSLRLRAITRQAKFKALLRKPMQLRAPIAKIKSGELLAKGRRPRRLSASSGFFAFSSH